jgi:hypothetical protein
MIDAPRPDSADAFLGGSDSDFSTFGAAAFGAAVSVRPLSLRTSWRAAVACLRALASPAAIGFTGFASFSFSAVGFGADKTFAPPAFDVDATFAAGASASSAGLGLLAGGGGGGAEHGSR